jgi:hypothetical protein
MNMSRWQIICPVAAILIAAIVVSFWQARNERKAVRNAIEGSLDVALSELEKLQKDGRFPSVQSVQTALKNEAVMRQFNNTSLFCDRDLFYNPLEPPIGGNAIVLCAHIPGSDRFVIHGDHTVQIINEAAFRQAHLVSFSETPIQIPGKSLIQNSN